jgi:ubiquinone/menaquinone biosynthesis C-methylase UbiE
MQEVQRTYLPAAGRDWALPFYDPFVRLLGADSARRTLLQQANLHPGNRVLDLGCGTGSLVALIKRVHPEVSVVALDPDPKALARAKKKAARAGVSIQFDQGFSDELPFADGSFDRVFSSFMFHHIHADQKEKTLQEVYRILSPGGSLHLLDFESSDEETQGVLARWLHSSHRLKDNSEIKIVGLMKGAGFANPTKVGSGALLLGHLRFGYYSGSRDDANINSR